MSKVAPEYNFEWAMAMWRSGRFVRRKHWDAGVYVGMQKPGHLSKMSMPYLYICTSKGGLMPWSISMDGLFSSDWEDATGKEENEKK